MHHSSYYLSTDGLSVLVTLHGVYPRASIGKPLDFCVNTLDLINQFTLILYFRLDISVI
jgi:hypothetical protein